jgi:hypothetical protein
MNRKNNCEDCQLEDTVVYPLKYGEQKGLDTPVAHTLERAWNEMAPPSEYVCKYEMEISWRVSTRTVERAV